MLDSPNSSQYWYITVSPTQSTHPHIHKTYTHFYLDYKPWYGQSGSNKSHKACVCGRCYNSFPGRPSVQPGISKGLHCVHLLYRSVTVRENLGGSWDQRSYVEGEYTLFYTLCTQWKSSYGFNESRVIYLLRLVQTGRQVDCHCPSIVLSSLITTVSC